MENFKSTLERILDNNGKIRLKEVRQVLILYEEKHFFIGDFFIRFDKLRYFRSFFEAGRIDVNFKNKQFVSVRPGHCTFKARLNSYLFQEPIMKSTSQYISRIKGCDMFK